ncbi:MAG: TetR/AcrR family transcriptional regulator [Bacteroidales bacterium]|nr:TetR/AcrR family transcriptional regulator [Bacteroidales bacterium]
MPLKTFENLPQDRQKEILNEGFREFTMNNYSSASLSRIIKRLNLAKGSFYRYFTSKKDLYLYLIEYATNLRLKRVSDLLDSSDKDFFEIIIENFSEKIQFDIEYPLYSGFLLNVSRERFNEEIGNIELDTKKNLLKMVTGMVQKHLKLGQLRSDMDVELIAFLVIQVQFGIFDFISIKHQIDFSDNIKNEKPVFSIPREKIMDIVSGFSDLLKNGMIKQ